MQMGELDIGQKSLRQSSNHSQHNSIDTPALLAPKPRHATPTKFFIPSHSPSNSVDSADSLDLAWNAVKTRAQVIFESSAGETVLPVGAAQLLKPPMDPRRFVEETSLTRQTQQDLTPNALSVSPVVSEHGSPPLRPRFRVSYQSVRAPTMDRPRLTLSSESLLRPAGPHVMKTTYRATSACDLRSANLEPSLRSTSSGISVPTPKGMHFNGPPTRPLPTPPLVIRKSGSSYPVAPVHSANDLSPSGAAPAPASTARFSSAEHLERPRARRHAFSDASNVCEHRENPLTLRRTVTASMVSFAADAPKNLPPTPLRDPAKLAAPLLADKENNNEGNGNNKVTLSAAAKAFHSLKRLANKTRGKRTKAEDVFAPQFNSAVVSEFGSL